LCKGDRLLWVESRRRLSDHLQTVALEPQFTGKEVFAWGSVAGAVNAPSMDRSSDLDIVDRKLLQVL